MTTYRVRVKRQQRRRELTDRWVWVNARSEDEACAKAASDARYSDRRNGVSGITYKAEVDPQEVQS